MRRLLAIALLVSGCLFAAVPTAAAATTIGGHEGGNFRTGSAYTSAGQTFTVPAGADTFLHELTIDRFSPSSNPFTVVVSALGGNGFPAGAPLFTSPSLTGDLSDGAPVTVYPNLNLTPGSQYAFYVTSATAAAFSGSDDAYPGGRLISFSPGGGWGSFPTLDFDFEASFNSGQAGTSTSLSCVNSTIAIEEVTSCTVTVANLGTALTIGGATVDLTTTDTGQFSNGGSCALSPSATCTFSYRPTGGSGTNTITAAYAGDNAHLASTGGAAVNVTKRSTSVAVSCVPAARKVGEPSLCTATVSDTDGGGAQPVTGVISFASSGLGTFSHPGTGPAADCTLSGGSCSVSYTATSVGTGTHTVTGGYTGSALHVTSSGFQAVTVSQTTQTISFTSTPPSYGDIGGTFAVTATGGGSGNPVTFTSASPSICTVTGATVKLVGSGQCVIRANQAGNASYLAAPQITQTIKVRKAQEVRITSKPTLMSTLGGKYQVVANATSGLTVTLAIGPATTNGACTITGTSVTLVRAGTCSITATQAGNNDWAPAPTTTQSFAVSRSY
jgi:hypothetical protein